MNVVQKTLLVIAGVSLLASSQAQSFNGHADNEIDSGGYYYAMTGGKISNTNRNGDNASGGVFRYLVDDPNWGAYPQNVWNKDDWFPQNAGLAMTLVNGSGIVYDNNGIENGTYGNYYDATAQGVASASCPGLYRAYSMHNNFDWIYSSYFTLAEDLTITKIIGYFDCVSGFNPYDPMWTYEMNIWSETTNMLPTNTGGFDGDVLNSQLLGGSFLISDTGVDRVFGADYSSKTDDIWRIEYTLANPITLRGGTGYYFSHSAGVASVPGPAAAIPFLVGLGVAARKRRNR